MGQHTAKVDFSKRMTALVIGLGMVIAQECIVLIALAILKGFTSTAAYLTAAVGLAEAIIVGALNFYIGLAKKEHSEGGITFEAAKAKNFTQGENSPEI